MSAAGTRVQLQRVSPAEFVDVACADRDSVLICAFDTPLDAEALAGVLTLISPTGRRVDPEDIRSVRHIPEITNSTALSLERLAPHTDGAFLDSPPPHVALSCSAVDDGGAGASTLFHVDAIAEAAPEWVLDALLGADYRFLQTYDRDLTAFTGPVLRVDEHDRLRIRWRGDHLYLPEVVDARGTRADQAVRWLYEFLGESDPFVHLLATGELIVVPNDRIVHGRTALSPDSRRELLRAWIF
jgi:hypothetical protein